MLHDELRNNHGPPVVKFASRVSKPIATAGIIKALRAKSPVRVVGEANFIHTARVAFQLADKADTHLFLFSVGQLGTFVEFRTFGKYNNAVHEVNGSNFVIPLKRKFEPKLLRELTDKYHKELMRRNVEIVEGNIMEYNGLCRKAVRVTD
ncbi:Uncharacterised protein [uncultured archaeon]|nr:Uncharacterised protein [uncultured archaeon]